MTTRIDAPLPNGVMFPLDWREARLEIADYQTAIQLARAIEDAAEAYLKEREERGE